MYIPPSIIRRCSMGYAATTRKSFSTVRSSMMTPRRHVWVCPGASLPATTTTITTLNRGMQQQQHQQQYRCITIVGKETKEKSDPAIERLIHKNRDWVQRMNETEPNFFPSIAKGQSPQYLYIGCSDSRVAVNDLMGVEMGELFVHRNIANMVISCDMNLLSVLTYAIEHLQVQHILVTGHYDCGGIRAAVQKQDYGQILDAWLQNIRDVYRLHKTELDAIPDDEQRHRRLVELNVSEQCLNLYKTSVVQRRRLETYQNPKKYPHTTPRIHGLVFDPANGMLSRVPIDFRREINELKHTYDLFDAAD